MKRYYAIFPMRVPGVAGVVAQAQKDSLEGVAAAFAAKNIVENQSNGIIMGSTLF